MLLGRLNNLPIQLTFPFEQPIITAQLSARYLHYKAFSIILPGFPESIDDFASDDAESSDVDLDEGNRLVECVFTDDADVLMDDDPLELITFPGSDPNPECLN